MNYDSAATDIGPDGKAKKENILTRWLRRVLEPDSAAGTAGLIGASMAPGVGEAIDVADLAMAVKDRDLSRGMWAMAGLAIPGVIGGGMRRGIGSLREGITSLRRPKLKLWHGTPSDLQHNRLSLDYIGEGEGAQAYGHGLYAAQSRRTAEHYTNPGGKVAPLQYIDDVKYRSGINLLDLERYQTPMGVRRRTPRIDVADEARAFDPRQRALRAMDAELPAGHRFTPDEIEDASTDAWGNFSDEIMHQESLGHSAEVLRDSRRVLDDWFYNPEDAAARMKRGNIYELEVDASPSDFIDLDGAIRAGDPRVKRLFETAVEGDVARINHAAENAGTIFAKVDRAVVQAEDDIRHTVERAFPSHGLEEALGLMKRMRDGIRIELEAAQSATDFGRRHMHMRNASRMLEGMSDDASRLSGRIVPRNPETIAWTDHLTDIRFDPDTDGWVHTFVDTPMSLLDDAYDEVPNPSWFVPDWSRLGADGPLMEQPTVALPSNPSLPPIWGKADSPMMGKSLMTRLSATPYGRVGSVRHFRRRGPQEVAEMLRREGLAGVRFHDGFTRYADDLTPKEYNYVLMDDSPISVVGKYAEGGLVGSRVDQVMAQIQ